MRFPMNRRTRGGAFWEKKCEAREEYRPIDSEVKQKRTFRTAVECVSLLMCEAQTELEKAHILDIAVHALGASIAADGTANFFQGKTVLHNQVYEIAYYTGKLENTELGRKDFDIRRINTYTSPWKEIKFPVAARTILRKGFQQAESNADGCYFRELDFATMVEGRHHSTIGRAEGPCIVSLQEISLLPYFAEVQTDGAYFYHGAGKKRVVDCRYAIMFHLASILYSQFPSAVESIQELRLNHAITERERRPFRAESSDSLWESEYKLANQARLTLRNEKLFWQKEGELCKRIIQKRDAEIKGLTDEIQKLKEALDSKENAV